MVGCRTTPAAASAFSIRFVERPALLFRCHWCADQHSAGNDTTDLDPSFCLLTVAVVEKGSDILGYYSGSQSCVNTKLAGFTSFRSLELSRTIQCRCVRMMDTVANVRAGSLTTNAIDSLMAVLIAASVLAALVGTSRDYALVFDEAFTIDRELTLAQWFIAVADPPPGTRRSDFFSPAVVERYWRFSRSEPDGHPPFYALLGLAGRRLAPTWLDPLTSYRLGPMALTAATCGLTYLFLARRRGRLAGLTAALLLVLMPRTFAHASLCSL